MLVSYLLISMLVGAMVFCLVGCSKPQAKPVPPPPVQVEYRMHGNGDTIRAYFTEWSNTSTYTYVYDTLRGTSYLSRAFSFQYEIGGCDFSLQLLNLANSPKPKKLCGEIWVNGSRVLQDSSSNVAINLSYIYAQ